jgi:hypothetical protein
MDKEKIAEHKSSYSNVAVKWLNPDLCFTLSEVLRSRYLRIAANSCVQR